MKNFASFLLLSLFAGVVGIQAGVAHASELFRQPSARAVPDPKFSREAVQDPINYEEQIYKRMMIEGPGRLSYADKYAITCLIYTYKRHFMSVRVSIFSTYKSEPCDPSWFRRITGASIGAQLATTVPYDYIIEAGPHAQLMDINTTPLEQRSIPIGDLEFAQVAIADIGITDVFKHFGSWKRWLADQTNYTFVYMDATNFFKWNPGSIIYKIVTDTNRTFVMTHIALNDKIMNQVELELMANDMGEKLNLPQGWRYESQALKKILTFNQKQFDKKPTARMVDEFGNIYVEILDPIE